MQAGIALLLLFTFSVANVLGQKRFEKGCNVNDDCPDPLQCINKNCNCEKGKSPWDVTTGGGSTIVQCLPVIGRSCAGDEDCANHDGAQCKRGVCVCEKENNCTNAGNSTVFVSLSTLVFIALGVLKM